MCSNQKRQIVASTAATTAEIAQSDIGGHHGESLGKEGGAYGRRAASLS